MPDLSSSCHVPSHTHLQPQVHPALGPQPACPRMEQADPPPLALRVYFKQYLLVRAEPTIAGSTKAPAALAPMWSDCAQQVTSFPRPSRKGKDGERGVYGPSPLSASPHKCRQPAKDPTEGHGMAPLLPTLLCTPSPVCTQKVQRGRPSPVQCSPSLARVNLLE